MNANTNDRFLIGWREWITFPQFSNARVKAKIDTGARTSSIHAYNINVTREGGREIVAFDLHPNQHDDETVVPCRAPLLDTRVMTNSGGQREERLVIEVSIKLGHQEWPIELSLTNRDTMGFRMLLGRTAIRRRFWVVPDRSFLAGRTTSEHLSRRTPRKHKLADKR